MIPKEKIDEIILATDFVSTIKSYVNLTLKGKNLFGLCPFHNEKSMSFTVSPEKQIYKCFGCGKSGKGIVSFIMQYKNSNYPDCIKLLADKANILL